MVVLSFMSMAEIPPFAEIVAERPVLRPASAPALTILQPRRAHLVFFRSSGEDTAYIPSPTQSFGLPDNSFHS